jgi:5-methylcytosine-specific restriction endonuclease McrBC regulatory subunit McrC
MNTQTVNKFKIRERSSLAISNDEYNRLMSSSTFRSLLDAGFITISLRGKLGVSIQAGSYVGNVRLESGEQFQIEEKATGAVNSLLKILHPDATRILHQDVASYTPTLGADLLFYNLILELVKKAERSLVSHLRKEYVSSFVDTSNPRGKIDFRRSMPHWVRGHRNKVVCEQYFLSSNILVNQFIKAALRLAESELTLTTTVKNEIEKVRKLLFLLGNVSDCYFEQLPSSTIEKLKVTALKYAERTRDEHLIDSIVLSDVVLRRLVVLPSNENPVVNIQGALFLNLEKIYEEALLYVATNLFGKHFKVKHGKEADRFVFPSSKQFHTEPDITFERDGKFLALFDAKYKEFNGRPSHDDLYEALVHAESYGVEYICLIYPAEEMPFYKEFGKTYNGVLFACAGVRLNYLKEDFQFLMDKIEQFHGITQPY